RAKLRSATVATRARTGRLPRLAGERPDRRVLSGARGPAAADRDRRSSRVAPGEGDGVERALVLAGPQRHDAGPTAAAAGPDSHDHLAVPVVPDRERARPARRGGCDAVDDLAAAAPELRCRGAVVDPGELVTTPAREEVGEQGSCE